MLSWRSGEFAPKSFVNELTSLSKHRMSSTVVQMMFAYIENTSFSARWWNTLTVSVKREFAA